MPAQDAQPPRPLKRRLPILARHAISLGVVFVLALPLSYVGIRYYLQQQNLAQLDAQDPPTFELGLAYIYANAATDEGLVEQAIQRLDELPDDRAIELHRVLLRAHIDEGQETPPSIIVAGTRLMDRFEMADAVLVYRRLEAAGAGGNPEVMAALDRQLAVEDPRQFLQLVEYYDSQAIWSRDAVPADAWLRWLVMLSHSNAELTQRLIARQLGELPEHADDPQIADALERLSSSPFPGVRAQVLKSAAGYAAIADDPTDYEQIIFTLGEDENQTIARRAWQIVGHLDPLSGFSPNWQDAPPYVAEAILWAAVKTNPDQLGPVIEAWDLGKKIIAIQALYEANHVINGVNSRLRQVLETAPETDDDFFLFWRSLPYYHFEPGYGIYGDRTIAMRSLLNGTDTEEERRSKYSAVIAACCYYATVGYMPSGNGHTVDNYLFAWNEGRWLSSAEGSSPPVYMERLNQFIKYGYPQNGIDPFYDPSDPGNIEPEQRRNPYHNGESILSPARPPHNVSRLPNGSVMWLNLWLADRHAMSNLGAELNESQGHSSYESNAKALLAGLQKTRPTLLRGVTVDFLRNHPDITDEQLHAMTDEQLAEFGLRRVDAIEALLEVAESNPDPVERYETVSLLKLALWMRGDLGDDFTPTAEAMLLDPRLPTSTVLLALLHKQRPIALEYLFGDLIEPNPDLAELFIGERFWHVFRRFVKTDDLDLWLWGDPAAQDFQIEAMRQWYWVNRYKIEDCWIAD